MLLSDAIDNYIDTLSCYASKRTIEYYRENLNKFYKFSLEYQIKQIPFIDDVYIDDISQELFIEYIKFLRDKKLKNVSINTYTRAVRVFNNWLLENNYIDRNFSKVRKLRDDSSIIYPLSASQVERIDRYLLLDSDKRNYCIFHLMLDCGLRLGEVLNLNVNDIKDRSVIINNTKFNKSRIIPLPDYLRCSIIDYLSGRTLGAVFLTKYHERITKSAVTKLFHNIQSATGIYVHPHLLRHTFATSFILGGGNLEILRILLGHSDYNITQRYLHIATQVSLSDESIYRLDSIFFKNYNKP